MKIPIYHLDAFTDRQFAGNPSAICPLEEFLDEELMQKIARENNPSETSFIVKRDGYYEARWFTENKELDLSGHGTLSSAYVVFTTLEPELDRVKFKTKSGILEVYKEGDHLAIDLSDSCPDELAGNPFSPRFGLDVEPLDLVLGELDQAVVGDEHCRGGEVRPPALRGTAGLNGVVSDIASVES